MKNDALWHQHSNAPSAFFFLWVFSTDHVEKFQYVNCLCEEKNSNYIQCDLIQTGSNISDK